MAEIQIDLEKQNSKKENNPKPEPRNHVNLKLLKLGEAAIANVRLHIPTLAQGEKVEPALEETPNDEPDSDEEPETDEKGGGNRLSLIIKTVAAIIVVLGLANFVLWVVINPRKMKFYVTDARLTEFSLTDDNTLRYNLRLNFTVRNPNKRIGFEYEGVDGSAYYGGEKFDSGNLASFYQPPKTTTGLQTWFSGSERLAFDRDVVEGFKEQKSSGVYPIDVKIRVYNSLKLGKIRMGDFKVKVKCSLKVPLLTNNGGDGKSLALSAYVAGFKTTQCHVDFNPLVVIHSD